MEIQNIDQGHDFILEINRQTRIKDVKSYIYLHAFLLCLKSGLTQRGIMAPPGTNTRSF
jgi:hypothetical protein